MLFSERIRQLKDDILTLWIVEQIIEVVKDKKELACKVLNVVQK
jgi:hypothetical protein